MSLRISRLGTPRDAFHVRLCAYKLQRTLRQMAGEIGVSHETLRNWLREQHTPNGKTLALLCGATGKSPEYWEGSADE